MTAHQCDEEYRPFCTICTPPVTKWWLQHVEAVDK